MVSSFFKENDL